MSVYISYARNCIANDNADGKKQLMLGDVVDGKFCPYSFLQAFRVLSKLESKGYQVIPPCDNIDSAGRCKGHMEVD